VQDAVRSYAASFADEVRTDVHGNVIACRNPDKSPRLMVAGHCDQIGMLVSQIDDQGFLYAQPIGGWDPQQLVGQRMTIWTRSGAVPAVIARKPIHLLNPDERKKVAEMEDLWLDMGAKDKAEAMSVVQIGDPVTLKLGFQPMRNDLANAPGMDDKTGLWVAMESLRRASQHELNCGFFAVSTVQEEIGLRGSRTSAFGIDPHLGIAVDVTHATDCPTIDRRQQGEIFLNKGPVICRGPNMNARMTERLIELAKTHAIPYQLSALGRASSNDANSIQVSRAGVATAVVAIPNRYMHSAVETVSLADIDHAAELVAQFAAGLNASDDFIPKVASTC
jgi:endoglucanase